MLEMHNFKFLIVVLFLLAKFIKLEHFRIFLPSPSSKNGREQ